MKKEVDIHSDYSRKFLEQNKKNYYLKFVVGIIAYFSFVLYFLERSVVYFSTYSIKKVLYSNRSKIDFEFEIDLYVLGYPDPKTSCKVWST